MAFFVIRLTTYPFRLVAFVLARLVYLVAAIFPLLILAAATLAAIAWIAQRRGEAWSAVDAYLANVFGSGDQAQLVGLFASVGLFGWALKTLGKAAWDELHKIVGLSWKALNAKWWPPFKIKENLEVWQQLRVSPPKPPELFRESFQSSAKLALVTLATIPILLVLIPKDEELPTDERMHVVVTDVSEAFASKIYLREGAVFSLLHSKNAKMSPPDSGQGVCLDGAALDWLIQFKAAVKQCMMESEQEPECAEAGKPCPVLEVAGYASIAPERADKLAKELCQAAPAGKTFNCKVANLRALAVGEFLAAKNDKESYKWLCPDDDQEAYWRATVCPAEDCPDGDGLDPSYVYRTIHTSDPKKSIDIRVRQWASEEDMQSGKPAADGEMPDQRRYRVEVLNRAVHINVLKDFCEKEPTR